MRLVAGVNEDLCWIEFVCDAADTDTFELGQTMNAIFGTGLGFPRGSAVANRPLGVSNRLPSAELQHSRVCREFVELGAMNTACTLDLKSKLSRKSFTETNKKI